MVGEPTELSFVHHHDGDEMDAYERLLGDAMDGDAHALRARGRRRGGVGDRRSRSSATRRPSTSTSRETWGPPEADRLDGGRRRLGLSDVQAAAVKVLAIDVGGTHVKVLATGQKEPRKVAVRPDDDAARDGRRR